ncbi:MAG: succinate dehydrogenase iron-sulfur subunit, partial [Desulfobacterales bacterium]|nr:succinate dehydrogenase iron-sulfur subunit [Desulfobacterales bacterium]
MASESEKVVEFKVQRFDPEGSRHYMSTYKVPVQRGMTILDALNYIKDNLDATLTFRHSCRMGQCGSCAIKVDGKPRLACYTQVLALGSDSLGIEPLSNMPIIKDLVVDIQPFFDKYKRVKLSLITAEQELEKPQEFTQTPADLKAYWDLTLCTKCAICYSSCPAALDGRFLGPSTLSTNYRFITDSRDDGVDERLQAIADNVWLCTSCHTCTLNCPKDVDSSTSVVEERSLMIETSGLIPKNVQEVLTSAAKYHNPMRMPAGKRTEWARDLGIRELPAIGKADILYFPCCSAAFDPRNQEIAKAMASIFRLLGADFAILGTEEWCCGDHLLRLGEKGLFEMLAEHNLSMFKKFGVNKIVTLSPHCFHTFTHDKPYTDDGLNVQHYTQFIAEALEQGKFKLSKALKKRVTYHDPCFLGKRNEIYDAPRRILASINGLEFVEMRRTKENSFCCGGGAGRVWTEDSTPEGRPCV